MCCRWGSAARWGSAVLVCWMRRLALGYDVEGRVVVDNSEKGLAHGVQGVYFRYMHAFHQKPSEHDEEEAYKVAEVLRCDVCETILQSLLGKAENLAEDAIADVLEGHTDYPLTGEKVRDQMLQHKKGCNKHFKDELISQGWMLKMCNETGEVGGEKGRGPKDPCMFKSEEKPSEMSTDVYELWKEGFFYACEQSIGAHNDDMAAFLAEALPKNYDERPSVLRQACAVYGKCDKKAKTKQEAPADITKSKKKASTASRKRRRANSGKGGDGEL